MTSSSEKLLISSVLRNDGLQAAIAGGITPDMFHAFPEEWQFLDRYFKKHRKTPSKIAFLNKFEDFTIKSVDDTAHFTEEVRKAHAKHLWLVCMKDMGKLITEGDIEAASSLAQASVVQVAAAMGTGMDDDVIQNFEAVLAEANKRLTRVEETGSSGIPTGFQTLDDRTGGIQPGDFWIIAARLGQGKSWTLQKIAATAAAKGYTVQFDALEQSTAQATFRIHSFLASSVGMQVFKTTSLMQGKDFDIAEYKRFLKRLKKDIKGRLHVWDTKHGGGLGLSMLASQIERNQPDLVAIDYITLMKKAGDEWQGVAQNTNGIKSLAMSYECGMLGAAQLNRENGLSKKEPPGPEALSQSDSIGQDADAVVTQIQASPHVLVHKAVKLRNAQSQFKWYSHLDPDQGILSEVTYDKALALMDKDNDADDPS